MSTTATQQTPTPKISSVPPDLAKVYVMFYRHGMNANLTKGFYHDGDIESARRRAEAHCKIMNYRFIFVRPLICDIGADEDYKLNRAHEGEQIP